MKKPYQIEAQRAVKQLEAMAADGNPAVQMVLPMAEMVGWLRRGVGELIRGAEQNAPRYRRSERFPRLAVGRPGSVARVFADPQPRGHGNRLTTALRNGGH
jgi:hypothetical protein